MDGSPQSFAPPARSRAEAPGVTDLSARRARRHLEDFSRQAADTADGVGTFRERLGVAAVSVHGTGSSLRQAARLLGGVVGKTEASSAFQAACQEAASLGSLEEMVRLRDELLAKRRRGISAGIVVGRN